MSSLERITEISGFGKSKIDNFKDAGYESLEDLQGVTWEELGEIPGVKSAAKRRAILNLLEDEGLREKPEKEENYEKFKSLLEELFQFESADLDFGIYKIMNAQRDEIEQFLNEGLQEKVEQELDEFSSVTGEEAEQELEEAKEAIRDDFPGWTDENGEIVEEEFPENPQGVMQERVQDYKEAKEKVEKAEIGEETEAAIYQDLYRFFQRYYKDGDFIPQRRASNRDKYAIPYNGEEVKLHWANKDQYFVKTGEHFKDYKFTKDSYEIEFKLHDAHVEKNNKKGDDKYFVLREESPVEQEDRFLTVHFEYRPLTDEDLSKYDLSESSRTKARDIQSQVEEKILSEVSSQLEETLNKDTESQYSDSTVIQKHLKNYRTKNENDYFIHKNLGEFLNAELEEYLKNDVFSWKELTDDEGDIPAHVRARLNAIENIAKEIVDFIGCIENYQQKLFEKRKFVVRTEYSITLDKVPEELYPEILENDDQLEQWRELYGLEDWEKSLEWTGDFSRDFLENNSSIMIDTALFDQEFKYRLLSSIDNIEEAVDGLLINSDNRQALNLIGDTYDEEIDALYLDPPYNANATEILYKNNFKHSSWLSLIQGGIESVKELLNDKSKLCITIDDNELQRLLSLMRQNFEEKNHLATVPIRNNPAGRSTVKGFSINHEYGVFYSATDEAHAVGRLSHTEEQKERYDNKDENGNRFEWENFRKTGTDSNRQDRPKQFYPILIRDGEIDLPEMEWDDSDEVWNITEDIEDSTEVIKPIDSSGSERVWLWGSERTGNNLGKLKWEERRGRKQIYRKNFLNPEGSLPNTWWSEAKYAAGSHGTNLLKNMFGGRKFSFPKSVYAVMDCLKVCKIGESGTALDYFAGSGTTGEAVIRLNEEDEGDREYILIEMGDYFKSVLLPRIKKSVYSREWNNGIPQTRDNNISQIIKYQKLEQYEDSLNNLDAGDKQSEMAEFTSDKLEYFLNFEVDGPSLLDLDGLKNPFSYEMEIREGDESKKETVDLVETFNYLLGLEVRSIERFEKFDREYRIVEGVIDEDEVDVVWRPVSDEDDKEFYSDEREFVKSQIGDPDRLYVNHDSALEGAKSIEKKFETEMWN